METGMNLDWEYWNIYIYIFITMYPICLIKMFKFNNVKNDFKR